MTQDEMLQLIEAIQEVRDILDCNEKTASWFTIGNPHFGGIKPIIMFMIGRGHKVLSFIKNAKEENWP